MPFDLNNSYSGTFFGTDRKGHTTPDPDGSEVLRPFLPVPYPAPWLPIRRRDEGHPVGAGVVLSAGYGVSLDKSGAMIPAGIRSGGTGNGSAIYQYLLYGQDDVGFSYHAMTGALVTQAQVNVPVLIACPTDQAVAQFTLDGYTISSASVTAALACDLIPGGFARPVGYAIRNVFQYLGGVNNIVTTHGMSYSLNGVIPVKFRVHNYMHEAGTAVQTCMVLRMPWIGADPTVLETKAAAGGLSVPSEYSFTDYSKSFVHFSGDLGNTVGKLYTGAGVIASKDNGYKDTGHFTVASSTSTADEIIGRVIGIEKMYPPRDYVDRVRTQFDRAQSFVGPFADKNPQTFMMGGSATRGADFAINLTTNGLLRSLLAKGVTPANIPGEAGTYVWFGFRSL